MDKNHQLGMISSFTPSDLQAILQSKGYRVEVVADEAGRPQLRSATSGLPFYVRFGNSAGAEDRCLDATLYAGLRTEGDLPLAIVNQWNAKRRFSRLQRTGEVLLLEMDISAVGGVSRAHLQAMIEIWDRLAQDLLRHLREGAHAQEAG